MALKMKELIALSEESKSTILYYVHKGLLPQPQKPKFNVHLYDESCVQIIKFIKYLQHNYAYSILEIQNIFEDNDFVFDGSIEMMISALELISGRRDNEWHSRKNFLKITNLDDNECTIYEEKGYFSKRRRGYGKTEITIVETLKQAKLLGLDFSLINDYVKSAQILAEKEKVIFEKLLVDERSEIHVRYKLLFDLVLIVKPYIFAKNTLEVQKCTAMEKV